MKNTLKIAILLIAIISMGHWMPVKQVCDLNSLSLQNVEALANGETPNLYFLYWCGFCGLPNST